MNNAVDSTPKYKVLKLVIPFAVAFALIVSAGIYFYIQYNNQKQLLDSIDTNKYEAIIEPSDVWSNNIELIGKSIYELNEEVCDTNSYCSPNGLTIKSFSGEWRDDRIKIIYEELLKNKHGVELEYLKEIVLKPDQSTDGEIAGEYSDESTTLTAAVVFNPLIDTKYHIIKTCDYGYINLYYMNEYTDIKQVARTLSHEYGHHYTFHHFFTGDNKSREDSEYYKIRGLGEYEEAKEYHRFDEYLKMHAWDIDEIAAEDYVQLLGSPTNKEIGEFMDIKEALYSEDMEYSCELENYHCNVFSQENPVIAMAEQVEGLEYYYNSFINENYVEEYKQYPSITIDAKKKRSNGKTHYILTWNELELDSDSEVVYTVVCYDNVGQLFGPIKTVSGDEELSAVIGTPTRTKGSWIYWWDDGTMDEDRIVRVLAYIVDEDIVIGSDPYYFDF